MTRSFPHITCFSGGPAWVNIWKTKLSYENFVSQGTWHFPAEQAPISNWNIANVRFILIQEGCSSDEWVHFSKNILDSYRYAVGLDNTAGLIEYDDMTEKYFRSSLYFPHIKAYNENGDRVFPNDLCIWYHDIERIEIEQKCTEKEWSLFNKILSYDSARQPLDSFEKKYSYGTFKWNTEYQVFMKELS